MNLGAAHIIQGNALALPLPDASVDLICTSPPYFGLRSYQDNGAHYEGQIGSEATPAEFLDALLAATREMVRVLKPSGSIFVNLGDKYNSASNATGLHGTNDRGRKYVKGSGWAPYGDAAPRKSLIGIPWRYAIACIDQLGLILRAEIIWAKPNGLPESVTDRVRRSHEQWFHLVKQPRYFAAVDEIREDYSGGAHAGRKDGLPSPATASVQGARPMGAGFTQLNGDLSARSPLGKLPGSVWTIPTQPLSVPPELGIDHFAAYPMEWPRRIIQGWTPNGVCTVCGQGRRPTTDKKPMEWKPGPKADGYAIDGATRKVASGTMLSAAETIITGYVCGCDSDKPMMSDDVRCPAMMTGQLGDYRCVLEVGHAGDHVWNYPPAPTTPAVVLDPFGGTGTTALVAKALGRTGISIDLSSDYCRLSEWRCNDPRELAAALQVEKPELIPDAQPGLFT